MRFIAILRIPVFIVLLISAIDLSSGCKGGAPAVPPGPQFIPKPNAWVVGGGDANPIVKDYTPAPGEVPEGYELLDDFVLTGEAGGQFSASVQVTIVLDNPVTPGTRVYLYRLLETGGAIPAASGLIGEDGRTVTFTLLRDGIYFIVIHFSQVEEATSFIAWAYADIAAGPAPLDVNFVAFEQRGIAPVAYLWDFGDGTTGTGQTASHRYMELGDYDVILTATDAGGRVTVFQATHITVTVGIDDLIVVVQEPVGTGNPREFRFFSTVSGGLAPLTYLWEFGDGETSNEPNPTHQYAEGGIYEITLTVTDALGTVVTKEASIEDLRALTFDANPFFGERDLTVVYSVGIDGDKVYPTRVTLDYGDGMIAILKDYGTPSSLDVSGDYPWTYKNVGGYEAVLTVSTRYKGVTYTISGSLVITVSPATPVITNVSPTLVFRGETITIDGQYFESTQDDGKVYVGVISAEVLSWSDTQITARVPAGAPFGINDVQVGNKYELLSAPFQIEIDIPSPLIVTISPVSGTEGTVVTLGGYFFGDGTNGILYWNGAELAADSWSDSSFTFTVPPGTEDGVISITRGAKPSNEVNFNVVPGAPDWGGGGPDQL